MKPRVLVVDDDPVIRDLLRATLDGDFEVSEAREGDEALRHLAADDADLVILDWQMPGRWGGEILAELKRTRPDLPVVVLTGHPEQQTQVIAAGLGASAFLPKPFSPIDLARPIEHVLGAA